jgi:glycosyltransferase involved in cell wall biosynthesis
MRRLTADEELRAKLRAAGPLRAAQFSWETAARETLAAIREVTLSGMAEHAGTAVGGLL